MGTSSLLVTLALVLAWFGAGILLAVGIRRFGSYLETRKHERDD